MTWRNAFIAQARHDYAIYNDMRRRNAAIADQLHYLQMATEKLSRGYHAKPSDSAPPEMTHAGFVRMLQHLKSDITLRRRLGYAKSSAFTAYIDSLLDIAGKVQALAPAIAGAAQPNPEYPWRDANSKTVLVPCRFQFPELSEFKNARAAKLLKLVNQLMILVT